MSEKLETWVDAAIGETRLVLAREGRPTAIEIRRQSDDGKRARWGEVYCARVTSIDRRRRGAFLDLGLSVDQGFLPLDHEGRARRQGRERVTLREGEGVIVLITREAARGKNPVLNLVETGHDGEAPHFIERHESGDDLLLAKPADPATRARIDAAIEDALARTAPIPGGGLLTIEPTAALVAIDVDAGARSGSGDSERFAFDLNVAAAQEAARQIRLRNLGGVIAIDFVSVRTKQSRMQLEQAVRAAFAGDPWSVTFGSLSRFGVFDLARAQLCAPLHERLLDPDGRASVETVALSALRALEREARAQAGRQAACTVAAEVKAWLDSAHFDWCAALTNRIGPRWSLDAAPTVAAWPREKIDARTL